MKKRKVKTLINSIIIRIFTKIKGINLIIAMKKQADYIKRIEIKGMWGRKNISWDLRADVQFRAEPDRTGRRCVDQ